MRHAKAKRKLNRYSSWRKATVRDIVKATLARQRICTTLIKAKEARKLVDRLITLGKKGTLAHKRRAFAVLCDHRLVSELFKKTAPRFARRQGGYTRIIPVSNRRGDNARMAYLELTEKEEMVLSKAKSAATSKAKKLELPESQAETPALEGKAGPGKPPVSPPKKEKLHPEKEKTQKPPPRGIRKIFRRKTGE